MPCFTLDAPLGCRDDADECFVCPPGYEAAMDLSLALGTEIPSCKPCPINTFESRNGSASCVPCPPGSEAPSTGSSACVCKRGYVKDSERTSYLLGGSGYSTYPSRSQDGVGSEATFSSPQGLAVSPDDEYVIVADSGEAVHAAVTV